MKKQDLKKLALLGVTGGLLLTHSTAAFGASADTTPSTKASSENENTDSKGSDGEDPNDSNLNYHLMTEQELKLELNEEGLKMYNSLDEKGKELAREVASMRCAASNPCAHLNACKTAKNDCAGKSECKGTGKCAISDKNLAVKLVYDKMKAKRLDALKGDQPAQ